MISVEDIKKASQVINDDGLKEIIAKIAKAIYPGYQYDGFSLLGDNVHIDMNEYIGCGDYRRESFCFPIEMIYDTEQIRSYIKSVHEEEARVEKEAEEKKAKADEERRRNRLLSDFQAAKKALEDAGLA